jgi:phage-related protein
VQFGDGYVQKGTDGINISKRTWSLQYDYRTRAEVDEMEAVLNSVGAGYLIWRIPPDGVVDIRWDFPAGWSVKPIPNTSLWTFTIVLEEVVG